MQAYNEVREMNGLGSFRENTLKQKTYGSNEDKGQSKFIPLNIYVLLLVMI